MYVCTIRHTRTNAKTTLSRVNSFQWRLKRENAKKSITAGNEVLAYLKKEVDNGTLEIIDGTLPIIVGE